MENILDGIVGIFIGMLLMVILINAAGNTYKRGQIDALTGNVKYELVTNSDKTSSWKKIKK